MSCRIHLRYGGISCLTWSNWALVNFNLTQAKWGIVEYLSDLAKVSNTEDFCLPWSNWGNISLNRLNWGIEETFVSSDQTEQCTGELLTLLKSAPVKTFVWPGQTGLRWKLCTTQSKWAEMGTFAWYIKMSWGGNFCLISPNWAIEKTFVWCML